MEGVSGKYLVDCVFRDFFIGVQDDEVVRKLWDISMEFVGLEDYEI